MSSFERSDFEGDLFDIWILEAPENASRVGSPWMGLSLRIPPRMWLLALSRWGETSICFFLFASPNWGGGGDPAKQRGDHEPHESLGLARGNARMPTKKQNT